LQIIHKSNTTHRRKFVRKDDFFTETKFSSHTGAVSQIRLNFIYMMRSTKKKKISLKHFLYYQINTL